MGAATPDPTSHSAPAVTSPPDHIDVAGVLLVEQHRCHIDAFWAGAAGDGFP